jgi:radical SAM-linked protein
MAERRQRLWLTYAVEGDLRWLGHLDLFRAWERALRRAGLPLLYSQGFNPRPRMAIALPLPVGVTSEGELLDLLLIRPMSPMEVIHGLRPQLPAGLTLRGLEEVELGAPSLQSQLQAAEYVVRLGEDPGDLTQRVEALMAAESCLRQRRGREYDLRPLIQSLSPEASQELRMTLRAGEGGTARPDEVLLALELSPQAAAIHRRTLRFAFDK